MLSLATFPLSISSVPVDEQQRLPDGVDLCIPVEDSDLAAQELAAFGNIRYVGSLEDCEVLIVGNGYLSKDTNITYEQLADRLSSDVGFVIVIDGAKELRHAFIDTILNALDANGLRMPVIPIEDTAGEKTSIIDPRFYSADIVAISFKPYGFTFVESRGETVNDIAFAVNNYFEDKQAYAANNVYTSSGTRMSPAAFVMPAELGEDPPTNMTFVGYIGWKVASVTGGWGEPVGQEQVKVTYYYCSTTTAEGTYKFFMAYAKHWAMGYGFMGLWLYHPHNFYSITDWNTDTYSDQILDDWGPTNSGSNTVITYGLTIGVSGQNPIATASISYSIEGGLTIAWWDQGNPANGLAKTKHNIANAVIDTGYMVEPSSIAFLDPEIGGAEPMVVSHQYQIDGDFSCTISFSANLYNNDVNEI